MPSASLKRCAVDDIPHVVTLRRLSQVLIPVLGDEDVVLDAHAADIPVLVELLFVDVPGVYGVVEEIALDVLATEVTG